MPYSKSSASRSVSVLAEWRITLDPLPSVKRQGEKVVFTGEVTRDGYPITGTVVEIYRAGVKVASGVTGYDGRYRIEWTIPYGLGCRAHSFAAYHPASGKWSQGRSMSIAYPTKITIKAPSQVTKGEEFTVSGKLQYAKSSPSDWRPLAGKTVKIYVDDRLVKSVTTGSDGSYSAKLSIDTVGTHTVKAVFEGYGLAYAPSHALLEVPAPLPLLGFAALAPALVPAVVAAASELAKAVKKRW